MRHARWFLHRLVSLVRRRQRETDLDVELQFHLDAEADEAADAGLSSDDARRAARRSLGNVALAREDTRSAWTWRWLEELVQDVRYAVRVLRRRPVFTVTALLSLALGLGANIAVFDLADNLMFKPLPVERPHELVRLIDGRDSVHYSTYDQLRRGSRTLSGLAMTTDALGSATDIEWNSETRRVFLRMVSDDYFQVLGVPAFQGRVFRELPAGAPPEPIAVISHDLWQRMFAGSPSAIGSRFRYRTFDLTVVGIAPGGFRGTSIDEPVDVWVPFEYVVPVDSDSRTRGRWIQVLARLRQGETPANAGADATAILDREIRFEAGDTGFSTLRGRLSQPLFLLSLVVGLVLLITCANVANLAMAGTAARDRELAVRQAIGASRGRVRRQLLTESVVLVTAGSALALIAAPWMNAGLLSFLPPAQAPALASLSFIFDLRALAIAVLLSFVTCLLIGLFPAIRTTRRRAIVAVKASAGSGQRTRSWMTRGLVVVEVAMCTMLLVTAGVFVRTIQNLRTQDAGYVEDRLLVADVQPPRTYTEDQRDQLVEMLRERTQALPAVELAAFSDVGQLSGIALEYDVRVPGVPETSGAQSAYEQRISPGFFAAVGARRIAGRDFTSLDNESMPDVAILNEAFVNRHFPRTDPIGKHFIRDDRRSPRLTVVVGVVADSKWVNLRDDRPAMYYVPYRQQSGSPVVRLVVRSSGDLDALGAQLVQVARAIDPEMQLSNVVPFREIVNRTLVIERLVTHVSTAFAAFGVVIACIGLYGILAFAVVRRTREIGLRIALGARPRSVEWLFLRETAALVVAGFVVGLPAAHLVTRAASSLLFGVEPGDPTTVLTVIVVLAATGFAASWIPARRAARIDPMQALRSE